MTHNIDVLGCGVVYIDGIRVFGSKPYGLFSTVTWKATDEDLKRIADRCLEVISDRKTENCSEKPNNCEDLQDWKDRMWAEAIVTEPTISKMEQVDEDINVRSKDCETCKWGEDKHRYAHICNECGVGINNYEPKGEPQTDCAWK